MNIKKRKNLDPFKYPMAYPRISGNGAKDIVKDVGIVKGTKMTTQMIKGISGNFQRGI